MPSTRSKPTSRCGHYELVKVGTKWKCTACGQILPISESIRNSVELSEVMRTAIESRIPLSESLDVLLGRREWEEINAKIRPRVDHLPGDSEGGAESKENQSASLSYSPAGRNKFRCGRDKTLREGAKENVSS